MIVKVSKTFIKDLAKVKGLETINDAEFVIDFSNMCSDPESIPGFKWMRQYKGFARIEIAPYRIGVIVTGNTIIFKRILHRNEIYKQFP